MNPILTKAYNAGGTISQRRAVKFSGSNIVVQCTVNTDRVVGISRGNQNDTLSGDRIDIQEMGIADCESGGTIARGDALTVDSVGRVISGAPGTGGVVVGMALESAVIGDIVPVRLTLT